MYHDDKIPVQIVVTLWIDEGADVHQVVQEMDYGFRHEKIYDSEIRDIITEI
jgi:hypothetical protein